MLQLLFDVATPSIEITYAAHTASCTFLLDSEGICRRIVLASRGKRRETSRTAARCVGAQYVASLDGSAAGGLVEMPRVGAAMLFARVDERGRISLVRTGIVTSFESNAGESYDPFADSGAVETSAPDLRDAHVSQRERERHVARKDPDYYDTSERTQRIQALRQEDIAAALGERGNDLETAEYRAVDGEVPVVRHTLRKAHRDIPIDDDDEDFVPTLSPAQPPKAPAPSRGVLPRRSDPHQRAAAAAAAAAPRSYAPPAKASDVQVARRRRI